MTKVNEHTQYAYCGLHVLLEILINVTFYEKKKDNFNKSCYIALGSPLRFSVNILISKNFQNIQEQYEKRFQRFETIQGF